MHVYREGYGLEWAQPVNWYNLNDPQGTLERFLFEIRTRFPAGSSLAMI